MRKRRPVLLPCTLALALLAGAGAAHAVGGSTYSVINDFYLRTDVATGGTTLERTLDIPSFDPEGYSFLGQTRARANLFVNPLQTGQLGTQAELGVQTHIEAGNVLLPGTTNKARVETGGTFADTFVQAPVPPGGAPGQPVVVTMTYLVPILGNFPPVSVVAPTILPTESYARLTGVAEVGGTQFVATKDYAYGPFGGGTLIHQFTLPAGSFFNYSLSFVAHLLTDPADAVSRGYDQDPGHFGTIGDIDFFHTALITGIAFADTNGNPFPGLVLKLSDGSLLVPSAVPVPEPASALLLAAGLATLFTVARRRVIRR